jgi:hypothetical protein
MKKLFLLSALALIVSIIGYNLTTYTTVASAESKLYLSQNKIDVEPGKRFSIDVLASSSTNYNASQLDLNYNPANLKLVSATPGDALPEVANNSHDVNKGNISYVLYKIGGTSGDGKLLNITFEGINGQSNVALLDSSVLVGAGEQVAKGSGFTEVNVTKAVVSDTNNTPKPNPTTTPTVTTNTNNQTNNNTNNTAYNSTTPKPTTSNNAKPATTTTATPTSPVTTEINNATKADPNLPNTGMGNFMVLASLVTLAGYTINLLRLKYLA